MNTFVLKCGAGIQCGIAKGYSNVEALCNDPKGDPLSSLFPALAWRLPKGCTYAPWKPVELVALAAGGRHAHA